jgi:hypothetical protein
MIKRLIKEIVDVENTYPHILGEIPSKAHRTTGRKLPEICTKATLENADAFSAHTNKEDTGKNTGKGAVKRPVPRSNGLKT